MQSFLESVAWVVAALSGIDVAYISAWLAWLSGSHDHAHSDPITFVA